jgi:hypothetical protein
MTTAAAQGKPVARRGRKARGLVQEIARPPVNVSVSKAHGGAPVFRKLAVVLAALAFLAPVADGVKWGSEPADNAPQLRSSWG